MKLNWTHFHYSLGIQSSFAILLPQIPGLWDYCQTQYLGLLTIIGMGGLPIQCYTYSQCTDSVCRWQIPAMHMLLACSIMQCAPITEVGGLASVLQSGQLEFVNMSCFTIPHKKYLWSGGNWQSRMFANASSLWFNRPANLRHGAIEWDMRTG